MNIERKYRKQVNENGCMRKLHLLCFGRSTPSFMGYCPFFLFTWFCLLFFPLIMFIRGVGFILGGLSWQIIKILPEKKTKRPNDRLLLRFYKEYLELIAEPYNSTPERIFTAYKTGSFDVVVAWIRITPDWENCAKQVNCQYDEAMHKLAESSKRNEARAKLIAKYAGYIVKPILIGAGLFVSFWFIKLLIFLIPLITWNGLLIAFGITWNAAIIAAIIFGIIKIIEYFVRRARRCPKDPMKIGFWRKIGNGLENAGEFIIETIETIYTRECPLIEWGDESGPITRNNGD